MEYLGLNKEVNKIKPIVSVCIQVYNNEEYIDKCISSILNQNTDFDFEIIIGEDDSTDDTRNICKALAEKNQDKIRLFLRSEEDKIYHRGRKTSRFNYMSNLKSARGKYIALCDGDDYWIDFNKLQKQVNILDENESYIASHHWQKNTVLVDNNWCEVNSPKENGFGYQKKEKGNVIDIFNNNLRLKARTLMFRNVINDNFFPDWFTKVSFADISLSFILGKLGDYHFMNDEMSVYRQTEFGLSKSGLKELGFKKYIVEHTKNHIEIWDYANKFHNYKYDNQAKKTIFLFLNNILKDSPVTLNSYFSLLLYNIAERKLPFFKTLPHSVWISKLIIKTFFKKLKKKIRQL